MFHHRANATYMAIYTAGFFFNHMCLAYLFFRSPVLTALVCNLSTPVMLLLLSVAPSLNVFGQPTPWYICLSCFALVLAAAVVYFAAEQLHRAITLRRRRRRGRSSSSPSS